EKRDRYLPPDLCKFYDRTDGAELSDRASAASCRIVPLGEVVRLDWGEVSADLRENDWPNGHIWYRLAWLADGSWLAINPNPEYPEATHERFREDPDPRRWRCFVAICHGNAKTLGRPGENPVVALSFTELLERLLDSGGRTYWLDPEFAGYGDAEQYT